MAFWDNWFKVECEGCGEKFKKDELVAFDDKQVCGDCKAEIEERLAAEAIEVERRRMAEEAARKALLDRPISTAPYASKATGSDHKF